MFCRQRDIAFTTRNSPEGTTTPAGGERSQMGLSPCSRSQQERAVGPSAPWSIAASAAVHWSQCSTEGSSWNMFSMRSTTMTRGAKANAMRNSTCLSPPPESGSPSPKEMQECARTTSSKSARGKVVHLPGSLASEPFDCLSTTYNGTLKSSLSPLPGKCSLLQRGREQDAITDNS